MGRGLADDDLKLTPKGRAWVEGSYPPLLDPRLSAAIEVACERVDPSLFDDPDREPWEVMVDQIVNLLPPSVRDPLREAVADEPPRQKIDWVSKLDARPDLVDRLTQYVSRPEYAPDL